MITWKLNNRNGFYATEGSHTVMVDKAKQFYDIAVYHTDSNRREYVKRIFTTLKSPADALDEAGEILEAFTTTVHQ